MVKKTLLTVLGLIGFLALMPVAKSVEEESTAKSSSRGFDVQPPFAEIPRAVVDAFRAKGLTPPTMEDILEDRVNGGQGSIWIHLLHIPEHQDDRQEHRIFGRYLFFLGQEMNAHGHRKLIGDTGVECAYRFEGICLKVNDRMAHMILGPYVIRDGVAYFPRLRVKGAPHQDIHLLIEKYTKGDCYHDIPVG